jgi:adenosine deaminase
VNSLEDPDLCKTIAERGLGLTVCPVSNRFCVQSLTMNEIRRMLALGMRATVNSDDPAYFRAYMNENLQALADEGMTREEIVQLVTNAFTVAWLDEPRRVSYLGRVSAYVGSA